MNKIGQQTLSVPMKKLMAHGSWLIALIFIISSCSTYRETTNLRNLSANHIIREIEDNSFEFDNLQAKFDVKFKDKYGGNVGLKGQLRMQNDSVIWLSLSLKLGVEVARVMITDDSVKFINRTDRTYFAIDTEGFDSILRNQEPPIENTLRMIQDILVGNVTQIKDGKYQVMIENDKYKLATKNEWQKDTISSDKYVFVAPETFKITRYEIIERIPVKVPDKVGWRSTLGMRLDYDNFQDINGRLVPSKIIFEYSSLSGIIEIDYTEIKIGEKLEFPFNISKKYDKIKIYDK